MDFSVVVAPENAEGVFDEAYDAKTVEASR